MNFQNLLDYCSWHDIDVFENCSVPEPLDIELVIDNIMKRCGLLRPIYAEPEVFRDLTKIWFDSNQWNFEHIAKIMLADYSPIENVYESDHYTTKHTGTDKRALGGKDTDQLSGIDTVTDGSATEHTVSAFNSSSYNPSSKDINSGDIDTHYGKKTEVSYGKTDDFTHGHIEEYTRLRHGNIGVTTNDQLITEEYEMLEKFNPYDWIAAKFERENFLQLY